MAASTATSRSNVLFEHLTILNADFGATVQNNIGIMGHSRGGEAVVKAARLNQENALGHQINAVIALAPTDQYGTEVLGGGHATPFFVLYGSLDGDIYGGTWTSGYTVLQTGFSLYWAACSRPGFRRPEIDGFRLRSHPQRIHYHELRRQPF